MRTGSGIEAPPDFPVSSSAHTLAIVARRAGTTCSTATGNAGAIAIVDGCSGPAEILRIVTSATGVFTVLPTIWSLDLMHVYMLYVV